MWIDIDEELINMENITTVKKHVGLTSAPFIIILMQTGKEIKRIQFSTKEELEDYYSFLRSELTKEKGIKETNLLFKKRNIKQLVKHDD